MEYLRIPLYVGSIFIIVTLYPWDEVSQIGSPFVATFAKIGITGAATIINFVVVTAAMSAVIQASSTSRMVYTLAKQKQASKIF